MFDKLRTFILANFPEILECYEPLAAIKGTPTPYCVLTFGGETPDFNTNYYGVEGWNAFIYTELYSDVIRLTKEVSRGINTSFDANYNGTNGTPFFDTELQLWQSQLLLETPTLLKESD